MGDRLSTKQLIASLDEEDRNEQMAFLNKYPYSALYYLQADPESQPYLPIRVTDSTQVSGDMILQRRDVHELTPNLQNLLESDTGTRKWAVIDVDNDKNEKVCPDGCQERKTK
jgi:hypothetical protein